MRDHYLTDSSLSAAILTGGASRRMGSDKALLTLAGTTLLERAIVAVSTVSDDVKIIGERDAYRRFGVRVVPDEITGAGALGGIVTALRNAQHEFVLVVACDMPFLSTPLLAAMADHPRDYDALVPVIESAGGEGLESPTYETLHAIYRRRCVSPFERKIINRELRITTALADVEVRTLNDDWIRRYDPDLVSFVNANYPADFETAAARIAIAQPIVEDRE